MVLAEGHATSGSRVRSRFLNAIAPQPSLRRNSRMRATISGGVSFGWDFGALEASAHAGRPPSS